MVIYNTDIPQHVNNPDMAGIVKNDLDYFVKNLKHKMAKLSISKPSITVGQALEEIMNNSEENSKLIQKAADVLKLEDYNGKKVTSYLPRRYYISQKLKVYIPDSL